MADTHQESAGADFDLTQFYQIFFEEAAENLDQMEQMLLNLDLEAANDEELNGIFRCAHSIKGGAATFGFADVAELTHQMESLLDRLRRHELRLIAPMVDVLLESADASRSLLARHQAGGEGEPMSTAELVMRIEALVRLSAASPTAPQPAAPAGSRPNVERQSILGSAYKRKAIVQLLERQSWSDIQPTLALARDAYARGAGEPDSPDWDPYGLINRLQLDALLGDEAAVDAGLIAKCQDAARSRFDRTWEFFDAIKPVDASLALWLADTGSLGPDPGAELKSLYRDAVHQLYRSALEFDSVVTQLNLLADFLRCRDAGDPRCAVLDALARLPEFF